MSTSNSSLAGARTQEADFKFANHGSIFLVTPMNSGALEHLQENVGEEAIWYGGSLAVEPRYAENLAEGLTENGYRVA